MKKLMSLIFVTVFAVAMIACDGGKKAQEAKAKFTADSTRVADSVATVKAALEAKMAAEAAAAAKAQAQADSIAAATATKKKK